MRASELFVKRAFLSQYPIGSHDTVELFSPSSRRRGALFSGQFNCSSAGRFPGRSAPGVLVCGLVYAAG
jgi:hypothetical protein